MIEVPDVLQIGERQKHLRLTYKKEGFGADMTPQWELRNGDDEKIDLCDNEDSNGQVSDSNDTDDAKTSVYERKRRLIRDLNLEDLGRTCSVENIQTWQGVEGHHSERFAKGFALILTSPLSDEKSVYEQRKAIRKLKNAEKKKALDDIIERLYSVRAVNEMMKCNNDHLFLPAKCRIDKRLEFLGSYHKILSDLENLCEGTEAQPLQSISNYVHALRETKGGEFVPAAVDRGEKHLILNLEITHDAGSGHSLRFTKSRYGSRVPGITILRHLDHRIKAGIFVMLPYRNIVDSALKHLIKANRDDIEGTLSLLPALEFYRCAVNYERLLQKQEQEMSDPQVSCDGTTMINLRHPITSLNGVRTVPNNYHFSTNERVLLVTGANNGGKTFYSKAVGLTQLLFQRGLAIPVEKADIGLVDEVYTHFVDQDDPIRGEGRYHFELRRMCEILDNCTNRSLIIVDEPCSGTEPEMGQTQSSYFLEALAETGARVIFNTHYHDLAKLSERIPPIKNIHPDTRLEGGKLSYHYRMLNGPAGTSYALEVAQSMDLGREALLTRAHRAQKKIKEKL